MKTIRINGVETNFEAGGILFEDFLNDLNKSLGANQQVVSLIRVDGKEVSESDESALKAVTLDNVGDIEVETSNPMDLAQETLNTLDQYLDRLSASIERAAALYQSKNLVAADAYFVKSIDGLDLFVQTIGGIKMALRIGLNPKVALTEAELVSVMNDLLEAKRQNNYVYLAELLEKELLQNIQDWKNEVFPIFRTWKTA